MAGHEASEVLIREMVSGDIDEVYIVEQDCFISPWSKASFADEINDNELAMYLVMTKMEQVIGYAGFWLILDEAHITNVAVLSQERGRGYGKVLLSAVLDLARDKGAASITLEVRESNLPAQKLYEQFGFAQYGIRPGYYADTKEDAYIMWRNPL